jgi:predicted nuclease of restriction endonuclease-like (RecB) superfamily
MSSKKPRMPAGKKATQTTNRGDFDSLVTAIVHLHQQTQDYATKAVNVALTLRNWLIGYRIVEFEQQGKDRAAYGQRLLPALAERLAAAGLKRVDVRELRRFRLLYEVYPQIRESVTPELLASLGAEDLQQSLKALPVPKRESVAPQLLLRLSFTHLNELIQLPDSTQRCFYEIECIRGNWSVRELRRQIASLYYERSGSRDVMAESDLEDALLDRLQDFLLELGHGICFEARQKRILIGDEYFFIDLVFYHRVLKCHILVELKTDAFQHEHLGQLNTYVAYYKKHQMTSGDQPPIGILLCTRKNDALVEYALGDLSNKVFVSRYAVELPKKEEMVRFIAQLTQEAGQ